MPELGSSDGGLAKYGFSEVSSAGKRRKVALQRMVIGNLRRYLPPGAAVFEIGTGRGEFGKECLRAGLSYRGLEPSLALLEGARSEGLDVLQGSAPPIPLPDGSVDAVHSMDVVEHLRDHREVVEFFSECRRILKPDGVMSVIAPNYSLLGRLFYEYEYQHSFETTEGRVAALFDDTGFECVARRKFLFVGALSSRWLRFVDRPVAHIAVPIARNPTVSSLGRLLVGRNVIFKVHKNLFDHVWLIGRCRT